MTINTGNKALNNILNKAISRCEKDGNTELCQAGNCRCCRMAIASYFDSYIKSMERKNTYFVTIFLPHFYVPLRILKSIKTEHIKRYIYRRLKESGIPFTGGFGAIDLLVVKFNDDCAWVYPHFHGYLETPYTRKKVGEVLRKAFPKHPAFTVVMVKLCRRWLPNTSYLLKTTFMFKYGEADQTIGKSLVIRNRKTNNLLNEYMEEHGIGQWILLF